jgi:Fur family ferric uptake transcriptional regulator
MRHLTRAARDKHRRAFDAWVRRRGLRWTKQRQALVEAFLSTTGHLTAEEFHRSVARRHPGIGFSTAYRTLKLLAEAGVAAERNFNDGLTRFEVAQAHHDHLICLDCHEILEFESEAIERLQDEVAARHGFELVKHRHELYGHCSRCR